MAESGCSGDVPSYKRIRNYIVDGFGYKRSWCPLYFLSHFHSDHYGGLSSRWSAGPIVCSEGTSALVALRLRVDRKYLLAVPFNVRTSVSSLLATWMSRPTPIAHSFSSSQSSSQSNSQSNSQPNSQSNSHDGDCYVTLLDANHCPAACMFYFEFELPARGVCTRILHTGDFRYHAGMRALPGLCELRAGQLDQLYLDTTYADSRYQFELQSVAVQRVVHTIRRELLERGDGDGRGVLFLFGAYTIGKERILEQVSDAMDCKVFVEPERLALLQAAGARTDCYTTEPGSSDYHCCSMGKLSIKALLPLVAAHKQRYARVVTFRPTGWSHSDTAKRPPDDLALSPESRSKTLVRYSVPYSEHSSFTELRDFVGWLQPKLIVPTVSPSKAAQQIALLTQPLPPPSPSISSYFSSLLAVAQRPIALFQSAAFPTDQPPPLLRAPSSSSPQPSSQPAILLRAPSSSSPQPSSQPARLLRAPSSSSQSSHLSTPSSPSQSTSQPAILLRAPSQAAVPLQRSQPAALLRSPSQASSRSKPAALLRSPSRSPSTKSKTSSRLKTNTDSGQSLLTRWLSSSAESPPPQSPPSRAKSTPSIRSFFLPADSASTTILPPPTPPLLIISDDDDDDDDALSQVKRQRTG